MTPVRAYNESIMNETRLIDGCLKGDRRAQKALYDKYSGKMLGLCMRYVNDREMARDLLQDGFVRVFTSLHTFAGDSKLETWMRAIFVNEALGYLRRADALRDSEEIDLASGIYADDHSAVAELAADDLMEIIGRLPAGYRTVFNMFAVEGYSHKEIAEKLHITENTSRSQYTRARKFIQDEIRKSGNYPEYFKK